ncbi:M48 family peptidase [Muribacter muris]|uniref:M48 family peptidase n=1 Tax=Muribacter muris TaxID=67855 RepID=A0A4Y9JRY7_9PAST|nr:M48 family metallopeptidase [Muribacter muris]MBF0785877.1 M48 family metallopeptidase [Muribacter muris]MBF0827209.1 M48 family metallopeptidase [Muribacter muris]TFV08318.1 M48 family peptidase [Muribacter muris]
MILKPLRTLALIASFSTLLTACVTTASINNDAAHNYAQVKQQAQAQNAVDTISTTAKRIHTVFNQMKPYAEKANKTGVPFQWEITVLKSNERNAWAMPGGKMAFYTGLVDALNLTNDEIAVVMGHEMAHALEEHGKSNRTFSTVTGVLAQVGSIALQTQGIQTNYGGVDLVGTLADLGLNKPFSRSQETEADEVGLMLMAQAGYNPEAAPTLWEKMSKAKGTSDSGLASLASTHPSNVSRQANLARLVPKAKAIYQARQQ